MDVNQQLTLRLQLLRHVVRPSMSHNSGSAIGYGAYGRYQEIIAKFQILSEYNPTPNFHKEIILFTIHNLL